MLSGDCYENELSFDIMGGAAVAAERCDSEANTFIITNYGREETITKAFTGLDHFVFSLFEHSAGN